MVTRIMLRIAWKKIGIFGKKIRFVNDNKRD